MLKPKTKHNLRNEKIRYVVYLKSTGERIEEFRQINTAKEFARKNKNIYFEELKIRKEYLD